jgi:hypothetical protein
MFFYVGFLVNNLHIAGDMSELQPVHVMNHTAMYYLSE